MGELESLLLVLALIYLSECLVWVRRGALAIRNWRGRNSRIVDPGALLGNQRGGFLLANPLPPLGNAFARPPANLTQERTRRSHQKAHPRQPGCRCCLTAPAGMPLPLRSDSNPLQYVVCLFVSGGRSAGLAIRLWTTRTLASRRHARANR